MRLSLLIAVLLAVGCGNKQTKPEDCPKEYAGTLSHCAKPRPARVDPNCIPVKENGKFIGCLDRRILQFSSWHPPTVNR